MSTRRVRDGLQAVLPSQVGAQESPHVAIRGDGGSHKLMLAQVTIVSHGRILPGPARRVIRARTACPHNRARSVYGMPPKYHNVCGTPCLGRPTAVRQRRGKPAALASAREGAGS